MAILRALFLSTTLAWAAFSHAADNEVKVYSARHYPSDTALYQGFTAATGIAVKRIDGTDAGILARLRAEGTRSAADVVLLVDATRLWRAQQDGLFAPIRSSILETAVPPAYRAEADADGATAWFGLSSRARLIVYDKTRFQAQDVDTYEKLASPALAGAVCLRSGSHPYNLSLFTAMVNHTGAEKTERWLQQLVGNMARAPKGGDTDQMRAVASGECGVAVVNSYYLARLMLSEKADDQQVVQRLATVFPNQASWGTHMNIAGGAVAAHSQNKTNAVKFLEYLVSTSAQQHFANGNNEWPIKAGTAYNNRALSEMSPNGFKADALPVNKMGPYVADVQRMLDRVKFQ